MKLNEWIKIWIDTYKSPFLKYNSMECLKNCISHIKGYFKDCELSEIKGYQIQQFLNSLKDKPNVQNKVRVYLNELLEYACRNRVLEYNPMLAIKYRVPAQTHRKAMSVEQQKYFIDSLKDKPYKLLFLTYIFTGARRNEVIDVDGLEIDFYKNLIYINGTKTKKSKRVVPLFDVLKKELLKVRNYKKYFNSFKPDYVTRKMLKHCRSIGLNGFCVHSLRTTFATRCFELGVDKVTVQFWLGHSKIETTEDIYIDKGIYFDNNNSFTLLETKKINDYFSEAKEC